METNTKVILNKVKMNIILKIAITTIILIKIIKMMNMMI
jgi:hypothetical protein